MTDALSRASEVGQSPGRAIAHWPYIPHAGEEGEYSPAGDSNETHDAALGVAQTTRGESGDGHKKLEPLADDESVRVVEILRRFQVLWDRKPSTLVHYDVWFRDFAKHAEFEDLTVRKARDPNVLREKLLRWRGSLSERGNGPNTVIVKLHGVQTVLEYALDLPYKPLRRRDMPRPTEPDTPDAPPDATMRRWAEAIRKEGDVHLRLVLECLANFGWRPENQLGQLTRGDVVLDENGRPYAVRTKDSRRFKTGARIEARVFPAVADALLAFWGKHPGTSETPLVPWRSKAYGEAVQRLDLGRGIHRNVVRWMLLEFADRHGLPRLTGREFRSFVKVKCVEAGINPYAEARLSGHKPRGVGADPMAKTYNRLTFEDVLAAQDKLGNGQGPLAMVLPPKVEVVDDSLQQIAALLKLARDGKPNEAVNQFLKLVYERPVKAVDVEP